jgi:ribosomal protein S8
VGKQQCPHIAWDELNQKPETTEPQNENNSNNKEGIQAISKIDDDFNKKQNYSLQFSQLEKEVAEVLENQGYVIESHYGPQNASIPIAVMDKEQQTALLGIEFDGPDYYQSRSARDRDRLRRQELEKLQWKIHRIWIIDWYYNKEREINRLIQVLNDIQPIR